MNDKYSPKKGIKKLFDNIKSLFRKKDNWSEEKTNNQTNDGILELATFEATFPKNEELLKSITENFEFRKWKHEIGNGFWLIGRGDGGLGQKQISIYEIARSVAISFKEHILSFYKGRKSEIENDVKLKELKLDNVKKDYSADDSYYKQLIERYHLNPRNFSMPLGVFYLFIALFLILADIPLALKLTQVGFDLDIGLEPFTIQNVFKYLWPVIRENWEVFILSFGIALSSIYIKVFYDEFLASPLETIITQFRNLKGINYPKDKRYLIIIYFTRVSFKLTVLIATIATIILLGIFRFESEEFKNRLQSTSTEENLDNILGEYNSFEKQLDVNDSEEIFRRKITKYAFIAITIIFPLISGILFSLGLNSIENWRDLMKTEKLRQRSSSQFITATEELDKAQKSRENWASVLDLCEKDDFVFQHLKYFINSYEHGYERGFVESLNLNGSLDLYDRIEIYRKKMVDSEIIEAIRKTRINSSDFTELLKQDFPNET